MRLSLQFQCGFGGIQFGLVVESGDICQLCVQCGGIVFQLVFGSGVWFYVVVQNIGYYYIFGFD